MYGRMGLAWEVRMHGARTFSLDRSLFEHALIGSNWWDALERIRRLDRTYIAVLYASVIHTGLVLFEFLTLPNTEVNGDGVKLHRANISL